MTVTEVSVKLDLYSLGQASACLRMNEFHWIADQIDGQVEALYEALHNNGGGD